METIAQQQTISKGVSYGRVISLALMGLLMGISANLWGNVSFSPFILPFGLATFFGVIGYVWKVYV